MLETWEIVVISVCIVLVVFFSAGVIVYFMRKKSPQELVETTPYDVEKAKDEKMDIPIENEMEKYGQQFAIVTPLQTALSPPRHQPANSHELLTSMVPVTTPLRIFSLSPLHECQTASSVTGSIGSSHRTQTPFQSQTPPAVDVWRGPTPIWTQYPGRH